MSKILIEESEYNELKKKAAAYDKIIENNTRAGAVSASRLTPEQRRERAKKAVAARMAKYGQKSRKN